MSDQGINKNNKIPIKYDLVESNALPVSSLKSLRRYNASYKTKQLKVAFPLCLTSFMIGYSLGWSAPIIAKLQNLEESPLGRVITDVEASWVASMFCLTNVLVLNSSGFVANKIGRKPYLIFSSAMMFLGYVLITTATTVDMIYAGRTLVGFGLAPVMVINLIYIGEMASPDIRGMISAIIGIFHVLGNLFAYSVVPFISYISVGYLSLAMTLLCILCGFSIPESPVYHAIKGNTEKAKTILKKLGRAQDIERELKTMESNLRSQLNTAPTRRWFNIFTEKINRRSLGITSTLFILQEASGALTVIFFATSIFKSANSSVDPHICTIILGFTELCGVLMTPLLIERYGRKILLLISTSGCALTMAIMGAHFYLDYIKHPLATSMGWLPLMMLILFLFSYNSGFSVVPNTLLGEMFTPTFRSIGSSFAFTFGLLSCFIISLAFGYMLYLGNHVIFWIMSGVDIFAVLFTIIYVPETKGKSLMEIQDILAK